MHVLTIVIEKTFANHFVHTRLHTLQYSPLVQSSDCRRPEVVGTIEVGTDNEGLSEAWRPGRLQNWIFRLRWDWIESWRHM